MTPGPWEILIIAVVIVLLFGAKKMPAMARSLGQSMRILKAETRGMRDDKATSEHEELQAPKSLAALPDHLLDGTSERPAKQTLGDPQMHPLSQTT